MLEGIKCHTLQVELFSVGNEETAVLTIAMTRSDFIKKLSGGSVENGLEGRNQSEVN